MIQPQTLSLDFLDIAGDTPEADRPKYLRSPCRSLLYALLEDLFVVVRLATRRTRGIGSRVLWQQIAIDSAWVFSDDQSIGSFVWACHALGMHPAVIRQEYAKALDYAGRQRQRWRKMVR